MAAMREAIDRHRLQALTACNRLIGRRVQVVEETNSTNDLCHQAAGDPRLEGLVVLAEHQQHGRGQYGRDWSAPPRSSLLFSILLFPPSPLANPPFLVAWSAVAVAEVIRERFADCWIKWPNDLVISGGKVAGILVERQRGTVVGIGVNVSVRTEEFPADLRQPAASLESLTGSPIDRTQLAADLLGRLDSLYLQAQADGPQPIWERWTPLHPNFSATPIVAITPHGEVAGRLLDLRPDRGARVLRANGAVEHIPSERLLRLEVGRRS